MLRVPVAAPALTLNRLCGSGFQAVISAAEEILLIRSQRTIAEQVEASDQEWTARRVAAEANGTAAASDAATST